MAYDPYDRPAVVEDAPVAERRSVAGTSFVWSPAQIIGLLIGIFYTVMGIVSLVRTGFDTAHLDTPHIAVWHFMHSPLLGAIETAFGVLLILAALVPGAARSLMALLGVIALVFGIVVLSLSTPNSLRDWLAVTNRNAWLYVITGAVLVLTAV
ncbi:MAG TPA: DUF4383 domain-containing protein, partial [Acidimicrobiia bacterium]|nr:DUF4383 domain-containing protein [Acidimicrobiia bacterium]